MIYINIHIKNTHKNNTRVYQYTIQNLNLLGTYMSNTLSNDVLTKLLTIKTMISYFPEVFLITMVTVMSDSCDDLEDTMDHMKNIKLE